jgi:hypothetical protein
MQVYVKNVLLGRRTLCPNGQDKEMCPVSGKGKVGYDLALLSDAPIACSLAGNDILKQVQSFPGTQCIAEELKQRNDGLFKTT